MGIQVGDNFDHKSKKPLDARTSYATLALMKAVTDANIYEGCEAYCVETDKYYKFLSTNTVDADTGKWREREDSAGHIIEDSEGTALTQRETLQFGEGFIAEDDDTNEKTVISPDVMQSGDMDDVVTPLPSVGARYHKYSTEEQVVGEWLDGKPIYEKTFQFFKSNLASGNNSLNHSISNIDLIWMDLSHSFLKESTYNEIWNFGGWNGETTYDFKVFGLNCSATKINFYIGSNIFDRMTSSDYMYVTIQYTKSTD